MPCTPFKVGNSTGFICSRRTKPKPCKCGSGLPADLLCDWKVKGKTSGTCDAPICSACRHRPAPDKDLCPKHKAVWLGGAA